ncbi:MAG TPA: SDR family NAD(P)-dependent oxidoreductase [Candidatus Anoxymicrobiaceae bacterium]
MNDFAGKLVLVTGAASGIGRATALAFSAEGARLALVDIDTDGLEKVAREIGSRGGEATSYVVDLRDDEQVARLHGGVTAGQGTPDVLMNAAGVCVIACIEEVPLEDWDWVLDVNLKAYVRTIHYFARDMFERGSGHIINVSSSAGLFSVPYQSPYVTSKFAVVGLSEALRQEADRYGVGVSVVCPGAIRTPIFRNVPLRGFAESIRGIDKLAASPEGMALRIVKGVRKDTAVIMHPFYVRIIYGVKRLSPRAGDVIGKAVARIMYKQHHL